MSEPSASRAEKLVVVQPKIPGGPWFIELGSDSDQGVSFGPYENPAVAKEEAQKLVAYLDYLLQHPPAN